MTDEQMAKIMFNNYHLTPDEVKRVIKEMREQHSFETENDVIDLTDEIVFQFQQDGTM